MEQFTSTSGGNYRPVVHLSEKGTEIFCLYLLRKLCLAYGNKKAAVCCSVLE